MSEKQEFSGFYKRKKAIGETTCDRLNNEFASLVGKQIEIENKLKNPKALSSIQIKELNDKLIENKKDRRKVWDNMEDCLKRFNLDNY